MSIVATWNHGISQRAIEEQWGAFPPYTVVAIEHHTARWRTHVCSECMGTISLGTKYRRVVYRDIDRNKLVHYATHFACPWESRSWTR